LPENSKLEITGQVPTNPFKARKKNTYFFKDGEWWIMHNDGVGRRAVTRKKINDNRMYVNGKYISKSHPLFKAGKYKSFEEAAFSSLENFNTKPEGEVYVITNPAWPEWIKVGMAVDSSDRLKNYQTCSPFRDYNILYSYKVKDRRAEENKVHERLAKECNNINEWFKLKPAVANDLILEVIHED